MAKRICVALEESLGTGGGRLGEIAIDRRGTGFRLTHYLDREIAGLAESRSPEEALAIARYDDTGAYRPLKSAPNLRRGWALLLDSVETLRLALDYFYPAMFAVWLAVRDGRARPVPLRGTLQRQSGMYAVTRKLGASDANELVGRFCTSAGKCLKTILWEIEPEHPVRSLPASKFDLSADQLAAGMRALPSAGTAIPLPCIEACNLLVEACRAEVKRL